MQWLWNLSDSIIQNEEKKNNSTESCLKFLHRVFKFIIAHQWEVRLEMHD